MSDPLTVILADSTAAVAAHEWNALVPSSADGRPENPFLDHAFFLALEQSGCATPETGWQPRHLLVQDRSGSLLAMMPLYLKPHSQGEYVFDHGWAEAFSRAGGRYYPKLQCSVPFTPVTAPKLLARGGDQDLRRALLRAVADLAGENGVSSVHATFMTDQEADLATAEDWMLRTDTQFHWRNEGYGTFEDFLGAMSSRHRRITRRERREALDRDGLTVKWLTGSDLTELVWDAFFAFYMDTGRRKWGRPYLNRAFFSRLSAAMADRIVLIFAYDAGEPIAGTLNLIGADTLYGRYWGALGEVPFLHFELCYYQAIDFALAHGLKTVEAGAQGEHKLARGYKPVTTRSVHWISHPQLRAAVADHLRRERAAVQAEQRLLEQYAPFRRPAPG